MKTLWEWNGWIKDYKRKENKVMTLDSLFNMAKGTQDAGETVNDVYQVGEISRKTGLQKQQDGTWAPPKSTKYGKVTTNKEGKVGIQQTLGKGSKFEEFPTEKAASRALANLTAGYNTTERSKADPHSDKARQIKHWDKEVEQIKKENKADRRAEHAAQFKKQSPEEQAKKIHEGVTKTEAARQQAEKIHQGVLKTLSESKEDNAVVRAAKEETEAKKSIGGEAASQSLRMAARQANEINAAKTMQEKIDILEEYGWNSDDGGQTLTQTINGVPQKLKLDTSSGEYKLVKTESNSGSSNDAACEEKLERQLTGDCKIRVRKS